MTKGPETTDDISILEQHLLDRSDSDPASIAGALGIPWTLALKDEWNQRNARCRACNTWTHRSAKNTCAALRCVVTD